MQTGLCKCLRSGHALVQDVPDILNSRRDDARATGGTDDEVEGAVGSLDDGGGDGGEGPFTGFDVVGRAGDVAEGVGGARDAKVVHFVVHDDAGFGNHQLAAEEKVDGSGEGDGHAVLVRGDDFRCSGLWESASFEK